MKRALLIIDAQVALLESPVYRKDELLGCIESLIDRARQADCDVLYVVDDDIVQHNPSRGDIHSQIAPLVNEVVIHKTSTSAFFRTGLDEILKSNGIQHVVVAGCKTEYCVDTTCRHAIGLGYHVTLVSDGHSTTANDILSAEQIVAHHNQNLDGLDNHEFIIRVLPAEQIEL